jgi:hypothetical protein
MHFGSQMQLFIYFSPKPGALMISFFLECPGVSQAMWPENQLFFSDVENTAKTQNKTKRMAAQSTAFLRWHSMSSYKEESLVSMWTMEKSRIRVRASGDIPA